MSTIREQIIQAVVTALTASGAPTNLTVARERMYAIEKDTMPSVLIYAQDDPPVATDKDKVKSPLTVRKVSLSMECRNSGTPADSALDAVLEWVTKQMFVEETFGGLANYVEEGPTKWNSRAGDSSIASASIQFIIHYRTKRTDPSLRG